MGGGEIPDMSENSDAEKSARERCIRVAAMDIMVSEGSMNIYVDKMTQYQLSFGAKKRTTSNISGFCRRMKLSEKLLMNLHDWTENIYH